MSHLIPASRVASLRFCPYDDILGVGHASGFTSLIIPGAGEPNFDARESNPYETKKDRRETEIRSLLDKLQPGMIALDPEFIGTIDSRPREALKNELEGSMQIKENKPKDKKKGKGTAAKRYKRKRANIITEERRLRIEAAQKHQEKEAKITSELPSVLSRFA